MAEKYISYKIEGVEELVKKLMDVEGWIDPMEIKRIVKSAALPLVEQIKAEYIAGGHEKTGALVNSIEAFERGRKAKEPYFTYYVGPRYTGGGKAGSVAPGIRSYGGNAAHLLEYGTVQRFRADTKKDGMGMTYKGKKTGLSKVYGAKISTGKMPKYGVIRMATDAFKAKGEQIIKDGIIKAIVKAAKKAGIST